MIEILDRFTRAVLYSSATANDIATAVAEAVKSRAYLSGAYLSGADLSGAQHVLRISGGRHDIVVSDTGMVSIGCHDYPIERWLASYKVIGQAENYGPEEIEDYADRLKLVANWISRQKAHTDQEKTA